MVQSLLQLILSRNKIFIVRIGSVSQAEEPPEIKGFWVEGIDPQISRKSPSRLGLSWIVAPTQNGVHGGNLSQGQEYSVFLNVCTRRLAITLCLPDRFIV